MADLDPIRWSRLWRGLIGTEYEQLYNTSAAFHHAIDQLAQWLPAMVDGLAKMAVEADRFTEEAKRVAHATPIDPEAVERIRADIRNRIEGE